MRLPPSIGCVRVRQGAEERSRGTAFLVGDGLLLTALHVVASRQDGRPLGDSLCADFPALGLRDVPLQLVPGAHSAPEDWALLRCPALPGANPLPLGELQPEEQDGTARLRWQSFGYPDASPDEGLAVAGELRGAVPFEGGQALQLFCQEAAAGDGAPVPGLSGAPLMVEGACVGLLRASLLQQRDGALRAVAGTLYATPIAAVCAAAGALLPVPDPYRGLPGLPQQALPERPFRSLDFFRPEDAEVFFGRGPELRAIYDLVTSERAPRVILLYGQSGVGKSSLLSAGLLPRLRGTHAVRLGARDPQLGLLGTLRALLGARPDEGALAAWARATAEAAGRPLLLILDQVEEHVSRPRAGEAPGEELAALCAALAELSGGASGVATGVAAGSATSGGATGGIGTGAAGRIVLGFRKEYLAELEQALGKAAVPRGRLFLDRMGRAGVIEVIEGLCRSERLRRRYGLSIEAGLAARIADELLADEDSPVTTILQVLLTELWTAATAQSPSAPRFTAALYDRIREGGLLFQDFLRRQLQAIARAQPQAVESGLVLDLLGFHTTPLGTAAERSEAELGAAYPAAPLGALLGELKRGYLLSDPRAEGAGRGSRLSHDTLGPLVQRELRESPRPGQAARRILEARLGPGGAAAEPLDDADLIVVERGLPAMRAPSEAERGLIAASRRGRARRRWLRRGLIGLGAAALLTIAGLGLSTFATNRELRDRQTRLSRQSAAGAFRAAATDVELRDDPLQALRHVTEAISIAPASDERLPVYIAQALHLAERAPRRLWRLDRKVQRAAFSSDLRRAVVIGDDEALHLYDLEANPPARRLLLPGVAVEADDPLRVSPDGGAAALFDGDRVHLIDLRSGAGTASPSIGPGGSHELHLRFTSAGRPALLSWEPDERAPLEPEGSAAACGPGALTSAGEGVMIFTAAGAWCACNARWVEGHLDLGSGVLLATDADVCGAGAPLRTSRGAAAAGVARSADGARTALLVRSDGVAWIEVQDRGGARQWYRELITGPRPDARPADGGPEPAGGAASIGADVRLLDVSPDGGAVLLEGRSERGARQLRIVRSNGVIAPVPQRLDRSRLALLGSDGRGGLGVVTLGADRLGLWRGRWRDQAVLTPPQRLIAAAVSPDRRALRGVDSEGVVLEWPTVAEGCEEEVGGPAAGLQAARFSPEGDVVATARQEPPAAAAAPRPERSPALPASPRGAPRIGPRSRAAPPTPASGPAPDRAPEPATAAGPVLLALRDSQSAALRWEEPLPGRTTMLRVGPHGDRVAGGDCPRPPATQAGEGCALWLRERGGPARRLVTSAAPLQPDLALPPSGPPRLAYVTQRRAIIETLSPDGPAARCEVPGEAKEVRAQADGAQYRLLRGDYLALGSLAGCAAPLLSSEVAPPLAVLTAWSRALLHPAAARPLAPVGAEGLDGRRIMATLDGGAPRRDPQERVAAVDPSRAWAVMERTGFLALRELRDDAPLCSALLANPLDVAFAPDGHHLLAMQRDGRLLRQRVSFPERHRPLWLIDLYEALVGYYLDDEGRLRPVPAQAARRAAFLAELRQAAPADSRARFVLKLIEGPPGP